MKNYLTRKRIRQLPFLTCLLWLLLFSTGLSAQNLSLTWDSESGCQIYKPDERKGAEEDIGSGNCVRVCENSPVTYTLNNSNNSWPAVWTVTGGTVQFSNNTSCTVLWGNAGWGFVSVTVTTPSGPKTEEVCIEIIEGPEAQFTLFPYDPSQDTYEVCLEEELFLTNLSTDGGGSEIVSYFWEFSDGTFSSEFEPSHIFHTPGDHKIILTITNACNCTATITKYVKVHDVKAFEISCNSVVCENGSDTYSIPKEVAEKCPQFDWKVVGGTITSSMPYGPSIDVTWDNVDSSGFGYVTFDASACGFPCSAVTIKVPVVLSKGTIVGDAVVCANSQYRYKLPQWPTTDFVWSVVNNGTGAYIINTDQRNEVIVTTGSAGDIVLRCTYTNTMLKCGGYAEYAIHVREMGVISGPQTICQNTTATYTMNNGHIASWTLRHPNNSLSYGSGNTFNYTFNTPGKYTLSVTGNDFCPPNDPFIIKVDKIPATPNPADIVGPNKICVSTPTEYSMVNNEPGTVLVWSVTNGTFSGSNYGSEVTITFTPGFSSYTVSVRRENAAEPHCQSAPATKTVVPHQVTPLSISGTQVSNICPSSETGAYTASYTEGEVYEWSISPASSGSVISGQNTPSIFIQWNQTPSAGTVIKLRVRKCNVYYNTSLAVSFVPVPVLTINAPATVCANSAVNPTVTGSPTLTSGTITLDFGDGSPAQSYPYNGSPTTHYYPFITANTTYTITATVSGVNGCLSPIVKTKTITVMPTPVAFISPSADRVFCNTVTPFTLTATVNYGAFGTTTFQWYKDGVALSGQTGTSYTVTQFGTYNVYVANSNGCGAYTNSVKVINNCVTCTVSPPPSITVNAGQTNCTDVTATASASPAPLSSSWAVGIEGTITGSTATTANITYSKAGEHVIAYYATYNAVGGGLCTIPTYKNVIIPFIPKILYSIQCSSTPGMYDVTLQDFSQYYPLTPATGKTFYVNGTPYVVTPTTTQLTVTIPGGNHTFGIKLTRGGFQDCTAYESKSLPVIATAAITGPAFACNDSATTFSTNIAPVPGITYSWNFGDGTTSTRSNPSKVYSTPGTYTVTVNIGVAGYCSLSATHTITVHPNGLNGTLSSDSPNCENSPITITFTNSGTPVSSYTWMKDTTPIVTNASPTLTVNDSGAYWVTINNTNGCAKHLLATNAAFIMTPDPVITGPDATCAGTPFQLSGYAGATPGLEYRWLRNGSPLTGWSSSPVLNYTSTITSPSTANFMVEVRITDGAGSYCVGSAVKQITTYAVPSGLYAYYHITNCNPYTVQLDAVMSGAGTFNWSNGQSGQSIEVNEGGPFMVTFTNPGGCTESYQFDVPKDPEVYFWIFPTGCYDFCNIKEGDGSFDILGPAVVDFYEWQWLQDGNIAASGSGPMPNFTISQSGKYQMVLDNGDCEKTTDEMEVSMEQCKCKVDYEVKEIKTDYKPFCHYIVSFFIHNPYTYPIVVNISANGGVFQPGAVTVPPGGGTVTTTFIPTGFTGGSLEITMTSTNEKGERCKTTQKWDFPTCRIINESMRTGADNTDNVLAANNLTVSPNPTRDATGLTYTFANKTAEVRVIEIYSLMGVLLETHTPDSQQGTWNVNMGRYAAGHYIVVMREDGILLEQKAIIVQ